MGIHITVHENEVEWTNICDMKPGQIGIDPEGKVYYRTDSCASCLTHCGSTYSNVSNCPTQRNHRIRLLPVGTKIEIEVTED